MDGWVRHMMMMMGGWVRHMMMQHYHHQHHHDHHPLYRSRNRWSDIRGTWRHRYLSIMTWAVIFTGSYAHLCCMQDDDIWPSLYLSLLSSICVCRAPVSQNDFRPTGYHQSVHGAPTQRWVSNNYQNQQLSDHTLYSVIHDHHLFMIMIRPSA